MVEVKTKKYIFVKGDMIDKLFADAVNKTNFYGVIPIERVDVGIYIFGNKRILAKIVNDLLVIRVGGGFMSVDEFLE